MNHGHQSVESPFLLMGSVCMSPMQSVLYSTCFVIAPVTCCAPPFVIQTSACLYMLESVHFFSFSHCKVLLILLFVNLYYLLGLFSLGSHFFTLKSYSIVWAH